MKILTAKYLLRCNKEFDVITNGAVVFDEKILDYGTSREILSKYQGLEVLDYGDCVLMPSLVNIHIHLEFSANKTTLHYGDFIDWLKSVISYREELIENCGGECIDEILNSCKKCGVGAIGAISSYGFDLKSCVDSGLKVTYFNEVLGSTPNMLDTLFDDFQNRLNSSLEYKSKLFTPSIAIHSPYSTHPILAKKVLEIAKKNDMVVSTHFMESNHEREWIDGGLGKFNDFFNLFLPNSKPMTSSLNYLKLFKDVKTIFTHFIYANDKEFDEVKKMDYITNCPTSNRLLGGKKLDIKKIENLTIGTDGLSSNNSINLWDELRTALIIHENLEINKLAKKLLISVTKNGAEALNLNSGEIKKDKYADMIVVKIPDHIKNINTIATSLILHTKKVKEIFINGNKISVCVS